MSAELEAKFATALARIAQLEEKLNKKPEAPAPQSTIDPRALEADPIGTLAKHGMSIEHFTKHFVANAMGDQAPAHLKEYVKMGQQLSTASHSLESKIESLGRRLDEVIGGTRRERFQTLAADKAKYPLLAAAYAADPTLFDGEVGPGDDAAEVAQKLEARLAKLAPALGAKPPTASAAAADVTDSGQAKNPKPAPMAGSIQGDPPIPPTPPPGVLDEAGRKALRDEIVRQYTPQEG